MGRDAEANVGSVDVRTRRTSRVEGQGGGVAQGIRGKAKGKEDTKQRAKNTESKD